ncbi:polysaccharide deacetylase family protein [Peptoniphilus sp. GNH]|nr:polysaccharide deacetylase family protein [Peptoniphilus sp. GNH]
MKAKKSVLLIVLAFLSVLSVLALINYYYDPFGVFDKKDGWYSYRMTRNPRTAKISYLNRHNKDYNAYVLGSSGSSPLVKESLDKASGKSFYNLFYYGADMKDVLDTFNYIVKNYKVDEVLLPITFSFAEEYDKGEDDLHYKMKPELSGKSSWQFYKDYIFADPLYANDMRRSYKKKTYLPQVYDVFLEESGNYDKRLRDIEGIGSREDYLKKYPDFQWKKPALKLKYMKEFFRDLKKVVDTCEEKNITYKIFMYPLYKTSYESYDPKELEEFFRELTKISDFYDFTYSSISEDPRFFYDTAHYRNDVGDMMIRKIYGGDGYIAKDFGKLVKKNQVYKIERPKIESEDQKIKVFMLHHIDKDAINAATITRGKLEELLKLIRDKDYHCLSLGEIRSYVEDGVDIPQKSVLLTFDDGYLSNYKIVYPLLKKYGLRAVFCPIGSSIGKDTYKDTGEKIIPHYSLDEIKEMAKSGIIEFASHGYDIHQSEKFEKGQCRPSILKLDSETEDQYIAYIKKDFEEFKKLEDVLGYKIRAMAYPLGEHDGLSDVLVREAGIDQTFTTVEGDSVIIKGLRQSMFALNRINIYEDLDLSVLLK